MLVVETIAKIRRAFFGQGKAICRELGLSRKVVRKVIRSGATEFHYEREHQPLPKTRPRCERLDAMLPANAVTGKGRAALHLGWLRWDAHPQTLSLEHIPNHSFEIGVMNGVDSELTCPVLVAHHMSAASAFVLLWDCGQGASLVHISTARPPSGFKRLVFHC